MIACQIRIQELVNYLAWRDPLSPQPSPHRTANVSREPQTHILIWISRMLALCSLKPLGQFVSVMALTRE